MEPCWSHAGVMLEPCCSHAGAILKPSWSHAEATLDPYWSHAGATLDPALWRHAKASAVLYLSLQGYLRPLQSFNLLYILHSDGLAGSPSQGHLTCDCSCAPLSCRGHAVGCETWVQTAPPTPVLCCLSCYAGRRPAAWLGTARLGSSWSCPSHGLPTLPT